MSNRLRRHPPFRTVTRLLAATQTAIVGAGIRVFDGDLDRFIIFTLIARQSMAPGGVGEGPRAGSPISAHAIAASLSRPYETVRRHVLGLIASGHCVRTPQGVIADPQRLAGTEICTVLSTAHDGLVQMVEDMITLDVALPPQRPGMHYSPVTGIHAVADLLLAVSDGNRGLHRDWAELVIYSTILCANTRSFVHDPVLARRYSDDSIAPPEDLRLPVRPIAVSRVIGLADNTVRRRIQVMVADGRLEQDRRGVRISEAWLNRDEVIAVSLQTFQNLKRVLERAAAAGFPFDDPASAYLVGRRDPPRFE